MLTHEVDRDDYAGDRIDLSVDLYWPDSEDPRRVERRTTKADADRSLSFDRTVPRTRIGIDPAHQ